MSDDDTVFCLGCKHVHKHAEPCKDIPVAFCTQCGRLHCPSVRCGDAYQPIGPFPAFPDTDSAKSLESAVERPDRNCWQCPGCKRWHGPASTYCDCQTRHSDKQLVLHPYHCPLDGAQLVEIGLGLLMCRRCNTQFIPTSGPVSDEFGLAWRVQGKTAQEVKP